MSLSQLVDLIISISSAHDEVDMLPVSFQSVFLVDLIISVSSAQILDSMLHLFLLSGEKE